MRTGISLAVGRLFRSDVVGGCGGKPELGAVLYGPGPWIGVGP
jgi:hypothetical protein